MKFLLSLAIMAMIVGCKPSTPPTHTLKKQGHVKCFAYGGGGGSSSTVSVGEGIDEMLYVYSMLMEETGNIYYTTSSTPLTTTTVSSVNWSAKVPEVKGEPQEKPELELEVNEENFPAEIETVEEAQIEQMEAEAQSDNAEAQSDNSDAGSSDASDGGSDAGGGDCGGGDGGGGGD